MLPRSQISLDLRGRPNFLLNFLPNFFLCNRFSKEEKEETEEVTLVLGWAKEVEVGQLPPERLSLGLIQ